MLLTAGGARVSVQGVRRNVYKCEEYKKEAGWELRTSESVAIACNWPQSLMLCLTDPMPDATSGVDRLPT